MLLTFLFPPFDLETMQNLPPPPPTSETTQLQLLLNRSDSPSELQVDGSSTSILSSHRSSSFVSLYL